VQCPLASLAAIGFALNWLAHSLDGTLARVRGRERPRYGFYVDHLQRWPYWAVCRYRTR
jgi:hypothetical protein